MNDVTLFANLPKKMKNDIKCWLPKVKQGGILAGHDLQFNDVRRAVSEMIPHFKDAGEQCWIYYK